VKTLNSLVASTVLATLMLGAIYVAKNVSTQKVLGSKSLKTQNTQASQSAKPKDATPAAIIESEVPTLASGYCLNVPVLMYHHIEPNDAAKAAGHAFLNVDTGVFESQMAYLSQKGYTAISADQLTQALKNHNQLPAKSIVLTFDDGYSDFYTYAFPVIKKYNLKANIMIPTGLMENSGYMTWNQLKEITASGTGFVYNHTWSHANLGNASLEKIKYEIETASSQIQKYLGTNPNIFTYPYGSENQTVVNYLSQNGFVAAFSVIPGTYQCDSNIMLLRRTRVGNSQLSAYGI